MQNTPNNQPDINQNKLAAAGSYFWCFSVVFLFARRDSQFVQFHAKQALLLFVLSVVFWLIPYLYILNILVFAAMAVGFITASQGEYYSIPIISGLIRNKNELSGIPQSLWNITKYYIRELKYLFFPRTKHDAYKDLTGIKIDKIESKIREAQKNIEQSFRIIEQCKKELDTIKQSKIDSL